MSPFYNSFGNQRKKFLYPEEYFTEINDSDTWQIRLYKYIARLLSDTYSQSGQEILEEFAKLFFDDMCSDTASYCTFIERSLFELNTHLKIEYSDVNAVVDYSAKYPGFYDVLLYALMLTEEQFGKDAQISVELYKDPEFDDEYVTICVRQDSYDDDILDRIDAVCTEYEDALTNTSGWLVVTTDFQPKRS